MISGKITVATGKHVQGNIPVRSGKSQGILPLGISRKSQRKVEKHPTYSEASKARRYIQGQLFSERCFALMKKVEIVGNRSVLN